MITNNKYEIYLEKLKGNQDLIDLIDLCLLDWENYCEGFYRVNGHYPEQRELLTKLKFDLIEKMEG